MARERPRASAASSISTCALAIVLPELWTPADEAELRQSDPDDHVNVMFGVAAAMRTADLDLGRRAQRWQLEEAIPPDMIVRHLGNQAVAPLRLLRNFDALAKLYELGDADALRAIVEHADIAWDALTSIAPGRRWESRRRNSMTPPSSALSTVSCW